MPASDAAPVPAFRERLWPSAGVWAATLVVGGLVTVAVLPVAVWTAVACGIGATCLAAAALAAGSPTVRVDDGVLSAGTGRIEVAELGRVEVLDAEATRRILGVGADARAWGCIRGWVPTSVKVDVTDAEDPTPYWVVSTRRPHHLAAALEAARRGGDQAAHSVQTS